MILADFIVNNKTNSFTIGIIWARTTHQSQVVVKLLIYVILTKFFFFFVDLSLGTAESFFWNFALDCVFFRLKA